MPYTVEWDGLGLVKKFTGYVSADEFAHSAEVATSHPEFDRAKYVVNDFTKATGVDLGDALEYVAVLRIGASYAKPKLRVAYVGSDDQIGAFISSLESKVYECGWDTKAFTTREESLEWASAARHR